MWFAIAVALLPLASIVYSQTARFCPSDARGICYSINIPAPTASSGRRDIFLQIDAPSSLQWTALGEGTGMAGANIFVIYSSADGNNVTISPRLGTGNVEPKYNPAAQVSLLSGSGISNGRMVANVRCSSCESWNGGTLDVKSSSSNWIWAVKQGNSLDTNDPAAHLKQHDGKGQFTFDLTKARGGNSANPFHSSAYVGGGSGAASGQGGGASQTKINNTVAAHGILVGLAIVVSLPLGALTMRLFAFQGLIWLHASLQAIGLVMLLTGFGLGVWASVLNDQGYNYTHYTFGTAIVGLFLFQPILGLLHHLQYRKKGRRSAWGNGHIWFGRLLLILAIIDGGLGLRLSANTTKGEIAYGVIAGVILFVYIPIAAVFHLRPRKRNREDPQK